MSDVVSKEDGAEMFKRAAFGVTWNDEARHPNSVGTRWVQNDEDDFETLAKVVGMLIEEFWHSGAIKEHKGRMPTAVEVARKVKKSFGTCVLATVMCTGWRLTWIRSVVSTILEGYGSCRFLTLHAVKGGLFIDAEKNTPLAQRKRVSQCDCEVMFVILFLSELPGVTLVKDGVVFSDAGCTLWQWKVARSGAAEPYDVELKVWHDASTIDPAKLSWDMVPFRSMATVPLLVRNSVISSPVETLEDADGNKSRVDQMLNTALLEAMDMAEKEAETRDW